MRDKAAIEKNFKFGKFDSIKNSKLFPFNFIFIFQLAAFWATWRWLGLRVWTSAEERWSLAALAAAIFFTFFWAKSAAVYERLETMRESVRFSVAGFAAVIFLIGLYAASSGFAPPLARAMLAMTAVTLTLSVWRFGKIFHFGLWSLLLLSLPSVASLQFFLGYPFRLIVGEATVFLLRLQGLDVWRDGVCLHFGDKLIWIDAPCSGIKMLWFGLFLAALLVCLHRLSNAKSAAVIASAFLIILIGNIFRASALFYIEAEIFQAPPFMHAAVGVAAFIFTALAIVCAAQFWSSVRDFNPARFFSGFTNRIEPPSDISGVASAPPKIFAGLFLIACLAAMSAPFWLAAERNVTRAAPDFRGFPDSLENVKITELPLSERESYFLEDFPGNIGRFTDGKREIIIRYVREATRKLHPAGDCFRAIGYSTKPLPLKIGAGGKRWSCFSAVKAGEKLRVCERIYDDAGNEWTDTSAWYWTALGESAGGWWAVTVAERDTE